MKKERVLTERELMKKLLKLRRLLEPCDIRAKNAGRGDGLLFLNVRSLMRHASKFCDSGELERLVKAITPYVPVKVSDKSLRGLLEAASGGYERALKFERRLSARSLLEFLLTAGGGDSEEWGEAVSMSVLIRGYKSASV